MPMYLYGCECGHEIEKFQRMNDEAPVCKCGKPMQRKVASSFGFILKGDGWFGPGRA